MLRLLLAVMLATYLVGEILARAAIKFPKEQMSSGVLSYIFGATMQDVIYSVDYAIFMLMLSAFATTLLRPDACAFMVLPCKDSTVLFFYRQDDRNRRLLGRRRIEALVLTLKIAKHRIRTLGRCIVNCGPSSKRRRPKASSKDPPSWMTAAAAPSASSEVSSVA